MKLVVGLGNPGYKYQFTRHNVGFMVLNLLADEHNLNLKREEKKAIVGKLRVGSEKVILAKPQTFMNNSGQAVRSLADYYNIEFEDILIVYDDLDLELGRFKIKPKGGHGGHNGIKSIFNHLQTKEFPRLKVGIGRPEHRSVVDYVLGEFSQQEEKELESVLTTACDAIKVFLTEGLQQAMNQYN
ncbi:aminoacyl-tRNA hydrolase [Natroniella sulfidigena]|uniref:aminoacyl-tRNA hydrolase n=1 Tax=Natroniella sulfidigena TaxID=723921 RepID=UPI00200A1048|nr:aminoacyl-tRNA hydrolase [Natroniella sulfidigena]MCK8817029.1 aminoacyl-tRNA hydrolase [Natroniella sulfidigena]